MQWWRWKPDWSGQRVREMEEVDTISVITLSRNLFLKGEGNKAVVRENV